MDVLGGRVHRVHDRVLCLPRAVPVLLRRDTAATRIIIRPRIARRSMWIPLAILAALSLGGGYINIPKFLEPMFPLADEGGAEWLMYVSVACRTRRHRAGVSVLCALRRRFPDALANALQRPLHADLQQVFRGRVLRRDRGASPWSTARARCSGAAPTSRIIDGAVNGVGTTARAVGSVLKLAQSGYIRSYAGMGGGRLHRWSSSSWALKGGAAMTLLDAGPVPAADRFLRCCCWCRRTTRKRRMGALVISLIDFRASRSDCSRPTGSPIPPATPFSTNVSWINYPPIRYHVGLDGLSLWLVLLTTLLTPISVLVSWKSIDHRVKEFFAFLILLEFGLIGVFVSLDLFLFYMFWEISLVPMYFLIGIWGHDRRIYAAVKFFLYTMAGSMLMLAAIIYLYNKSGTFDYLDILSQIADRPPGARRRTRRCCCSWRSSSSFADQGPAVPAAHLAARRARRSAHRGFRHAGFRHAENGHLRTGALLPAAVPQRRARFRALGRRRSPSSASFTERWSPWCSRT